MKAAGLFGLGQTPGGCLAAIQEILKDVEALDVYLLHGVLAPGQTPPDPSDIARQIQQKDFKSRVCYRSCAPIDTFDLSSAYSTARETVDKIAKEEYDRVYVGITGGANPMIASTFHCAMTYLATEVVPIYAQGKGQETERTYVAPDIRLAVLAEEAVRTARSGQLRLAAQLANRLPKTREWSFARSCLAALAAWDDFDYAKASHDLQHQGRHCAEYRSHPCLSGLADTVDRLAAVAGPMARITKAFRDIEGFKKRASEQEWPATARSGGVLLVADTIENAKRRLHEGRYTDSVLRAYRAAECAVQVRLFEIGIHPSEPRAYGEAFAKVSEKVNGEGPLAFRAGLDLLKSIGVECERKIVDYVYDLCQSRNNSYLEHGYVRVEKNSAERCVSHCETICQHLLNHVPPDRWPDLSMRF